MMPSKNSRAALYVRVSLDEQAKHGYSIEGQINALRSYCEMHHLDIYDIYIDAGASGKAITGRPELKRMLEDGKLQRYDLVVIWRISRLSRNLVDLLKIVDLFKEMDIRLHSFMERFDTETIHGNFVLQIMGAAAQLERDYISDNVRLASIERSRQGKWNCGNNVLGYRWIQGNDSQPGRVEIVAEEAKLVHRIFELYASGRFGLKAITNRMNKEAHRTKNDKPFSILSIRGILLNCNYIGLVRLNVSEHRRSKGSIPIELANGEHEPIIAKDLWEQVQSVYAQRSTKPKRVIQRKFPLTGLLRCPQCGKGMVAGHTRHIRKNGSKRINYYYVCGSFNSKGSSACKANGLNADRIEQWFYKKLERLLSAPEVINDISAFATRKQDSARKPLLERLQNCKTETNHLESQQKQAFLSFEKGTTTQEDLLQTLESIKYRQQQLERECDQIERELAAHQVQEYPAEAVRESLQQLQQMLGLEPDLRQKQLIRLLVDKITVPPDRNLNGAVIHGNATQLPIKITNQMEA